MKAVRDKGYVMTPESVLFVDDEELVLSSYQRVFRKQFQFDVALSGQQAIDAIHSQGPYAVVVSDMRMPGMNGIELLRRVKEISPQTVRLMLTGNSDVQTAIAAVNEGHVFRFLTKPCSSETLAVAISDGLAQYRLVHAEKELLEDTLHGSVRLLTEVLALVNPVGFNQSSRVAKYVKSVVRQMKIADAWQVEVAALLSNLGCVVLPKETTRRSDQAQAAQRLLCNIPRLDKVAAIVGRLGAEPVPMTDDPVGLGTEIIRTCTDFDFFMSPEVTSEAAIQRLRDSPDKHYAASIVDALAVVAHELFEYEPQLVRTDDLNDHMVLNEDLLTISGTLLVTKGSPITQSLLLRLRNFRDRRLLPNEVRVLVSAPCLTRAK
jgi:CheY-like chemotaxis protein